jgi:hypothetical protein
VASGAGANRVGEFGGLVLLRLRPDAAAYTTDPRLGYGTIGVNDSGLCMIEAQGFTKWTMQLCPEPLGVGLPDGYEVSLYGTIDRTGYLAWEEKNYGPTGGPMGSTIVPPGSWMLLSAPSDQSGTGTDGNPLTFRTPALAPSRGLLAVRAVLTASTSPSGGAVVYGNAVP